MRVEARREVEPAQEAPLGRVRIGEGGEVVVRVRFERVDLIPHAPNRERRRVSNARRKE